VERDFKIAIVFTIQGIGLGIALHVIWNIYL